MATTISYLLPLGYVDCNIATSSTTKTTSIARCKRSKYRMGKLRRMNTSIATDQAQIEPLETTTQWDVFNQNGGASCVGSDYSFKKWFPRLWLQLPACCPSAPHRPLSSLEAASRLGSESAVAILRTLNCDSCKVAADRKDCDFEGLGDALWHAC